MNRTAQREASVEDARATLSPTLRISNLSKSFGSAHALKGVDITVGAGQIHALLGQNGSGKSTLIKILAGYHLGDSGAVDICGNTVDFTHHAERVPQADISFVHQDLALVGTLSVLDNLRIASYAERGIRPVRWKEHRRAAEDGLRAVGLDSLPLTMPIDSLSEVERALVAIARAIRKVDESSRPGLLVLDEPTAYLPRDSIRRLFEVIRAVAARGVSVLLVTHKLDEVVDIADHVTVLTDGQVTGELSGAQITEEALIRLILGRDLVTDANDRRPDAAATADDAACAAPTRCMVRGLSGGRVSDLGIDIEQGEIVGITGLLGSGFEEVPGLLYEGGAASGTLTLDGRTHDLVGSSAHRSRELRIALVPANRLREGISGELTIAENISLPVLDRHWRRGMLRLKSVNQKVDQLLREYGVTPADSSRPAKTLSGGNQQKCLLAKWIQTDPRLLVLHEPTQGVDVGARKEILDIVRRVARAGTFVLVATSEYDDLVQVCDRVIVLRDGVPIANLSGPFANADPIVEAASRS
ncbi:MAG: sugar transporter ATP-binding protein [Acidimicrobiaceae bacterium]|nr:sugar transporter ATP-binding protein [Acidimicrobiaceae bacterium]